MKLELGKGNINIPETGLVALVGLYVSWMLWVTSSLYSQKQDLALIKQVVLAQSEQARMLPNPAVDQEIVVSEIKVPKRRVSANESASDRL